ncbi:hypothetical protein IFR05_016246 [Cadophora sp. M221]|nr:hypothetical protein IFR05_016246 [Cadophora sp. M221]
MSDAMTTLARAIVPPKERSLSERGLVSWGGYGLHISPCIEGTTACGDSCCPSSYKCASPGNYKVNLNPEAICCPTDTDCSATVRVVQACADTSWGLYHVLGEYCCPPDMVGIYPKDDGPMCMLASLPIPSDRLAAAVKQATTANSAVATAGSSKTSSAGSSVSSSTSSATIASGSGTTTSGSDTQSPAGTTDNSTQSSSKSSGLSKGATIAIAVLAAALGLLSIIIIWYFWKKKRRSARGGLSASEPPPAQPVNQPPYSSAPEKAPDSQPVVETKSAEFRVNELSGRNVLHSNDAMELHTPHRAELHDTARMY